MSSGEKQLRWFFFLYMWFNPIEYLNPNFCLMSLYCHIRTRNFSTSLMNLSFIPVPFIVSFLNFIFISSKQTPPPPIFRLISWTGRKIDPVGVDYILQKLGFHHARTTIPKWLQRGVMDPLDKVLSVLIKKLGTALQDEKERKGRDKEEHWGRESCPQGSDPPAATTVQRFIWFRFVFYD